MSYRKWQMQIISNEYLQQGLTALHQVGDRQTSQSALQLDAGLQSGIQGKETEYW